MISIKRGSSDADRNCKKSKTDESNSNCDDDQSSSSSMVCCDKQGHLLCFCLFEKFHSDIDPEEARAKVDVLRVAVTHKDVSTHDAIKWLGTFCELEFHLLDEDFYTIEWVCALAEANELIRDLLRGQIEDTMTDQICFVITCTQRNPVLCFIQNANKLEEHDFDVIFYSSESTICAPLVGEQPSEKWHAACRLIYGLYCQTDTAIHPPDMTFDPLSPDLKDNYCFTKAEVCSAIGDPAFKWAIPCLQTPKEIKSSAATRIFNIKID